MPENSYSSSEKQSVFRNLETNFFLNFSMVCSMIMGTLFKKQNEIHKKSNPSQDRVPWFNIWGSFEFCNVEVVCGPKLIESDGQAAREALVVSEDILPCFLHKLI